MALLDRLNKYSSEDLTEDLTGDEPENIAEATEVESSLIEAQEREEELNDIEADVDTAETALESMCELITSLEEAVERGGMSPEEAKFYNMHRHLTYKTFGQKQHIKGVAVESFSGVSSRLTMTKISLEEEKGRLKSWWEAFVRFIKTAAAKTKDFIVGLFSGIQALQGRIQTLLKQARDKDAKAEGKLTKSQRKKYGKIFRYQNDSPVFTLDTIITKITNSITYGINLKTAAKNLSTMSLSVIQSAVKGDGLAEVNKQTGVDISGNPITTKEYEDSLKNIGAGPGKFEENDELKKKDNLSTDVEATYKVVGSYGSGYELYFRITREKLASDKTSTQVDVDDEGKFTNISLTPFFKSVHEVKEEDSKLFDETQFDLKSIQDTLQFLLKNCNNLRKMGESIKSYNDEFAKLTDSISGKVNSIPENIASGFKKILNSLKQIFTGGSALSRWYKYLISWTKDLLNVISIRLSNAPGDDEDKKEEDENKEEEKK